MKKICLTLLFLSVAFAAQGLALEEHSKKYWKEYEELMSGANHRRMQPQMNTRPHAELISQRTLTEAYPHTKPSQGNAIYGLTLMKCQKISQILGEKYGNNPENSDFDWPQINKIFLVRFFQASTELSLADTLRSLSATLDLKNQQTVIDFLTNFNEYSSWRMQEIEYYEIRDFFHQFVEIENLIFKESFK